MGDGSRSSGEGYATPETAGTEGGILRVLAAGFRAAGPPGPITIHSGVMDEDEALSR